MRSATNDKSHSTTLLSVSALPLGSLEGCLGAGSQPSKDRDSDIRSWGHGDDCQEGSSKKPSLTLQELTLHKEDRRAESDLVPAWEPREQNSRGCANHG